MINHWAFHASKYGCASLVLALKLILGAGVVPFISISERSAALHSAPHWSIIGGDDDLLDNKNAKSASEFSPLWIVQLR